MAFGVPVRAREDTFTDKVRAETLVQGVQDFQSSINQARPGFPAPARRATRDATKLRDSAEPRAKAMLALGFLSGFGIVAMIAQFGEMDTHCEEMSWLSGPSPFVWLNSKQ